jgi:integrase/recombinase XerD
MSQPKPKGARKRDRAPDNLYQREGVWWIRYNVNGRKIRRSLGTTSQREAKRLRDQILAKRSVAAKFGIEEPIPRKEWMFSEVVEAWLKWREANGGFRAATVSSAEYVARGRIQPKFGNRPIADITVEDVEQFIAHLRSTKSERTREPLKRAYIAKICKYLGTIFGFAQKRNMLNGPNPFEQLDKKPTVGPGRDVRLTEEEARCLLAKLSGETYYKVALALSTGLRWGEIHGLAWADIALDGQSSTITIRRSWRGDPKSESSATTIPISDDAAAILRQWTAEQGKAVYVFPSAKGELRTSPKRQEVIAISKAAQEAGITCKVTPHVFRHTFATWTYERVKDPRKLQRLLRHASFDTSMAYVHDRADLAGVVNQLPALSQPRLRSV